MFLSIALAAATTQVEACSAAVHGNLVDAVSACAAEGRVDVLNPGGISETCAAALTAGRQAGKFGPHLPPAGRTGLIREFDTKLAACRSPVAKQPIPERPTVNLWD